MTICTLEELHAATPIVRRYFPATPAYSWPLLNEAIGTEVWVKHENATPTGAFKVRGGLLYADTLKRERPDVRGIVSATRGNHGISLSYAGRAYGIPVVICVPETNALEKNAAMRSLGAEVVIGGEDFDAARARSVAIAAERGYEMVPPFHRDLVRGVATYAVELFEQAGPLDRVYVPIGMGTGCSGLITARDLLGLNTEIIGVGVEGAPAQALSFAAGEVRTTNAVRTFVDGVATRSPDAVSAKIIREGASRVVVVSDDDAADAIRLLWSTTHHLAEPAGSLALAAMYKERESNAGKRVSFILCGSNMDTAMAAQVLAGKTPAFC
jgi:threonine dehydratase